MWLERVADLRNGTGRALNHDQPTAHGILAYELSGHTFSAQVFNGTKRPIPGRDWYHNSVRSRAHDALPPRKGWGANNFDSAVLLSRLLDAGHVHRR